MKLEEAIKVIDAELAEKEGRQAALLQKSRNAVRACAKAIKALHVGEEPDLKALDAAVEELQSMDAGFEGITRTAYQEYAEIKCFHAIKNKRELPDYRELGIPPLQWLTGLCDCVGELRRALQIALKDGEKEEADYYFQKMNELYDNVMVLNYSGSIVGNLKPKQDAARRQVEQARSEVLRC
jgi:translin